MNKSKRQTLISILALGSVHTALPGKWVNPLVKVIVLPAHAMTSTETGDPGSSNCSGFDTQAVDEPISITVTEAEIRGPIVVPLEGNSFSGEQSSSAGLCGPDNEELTQVVTFNGVIDSIANQITGEFNVIQFCGDALACEQITSFTASQNPVVSDSDLGEYQGQVIGTLRCCNDFI